MCNDQHKSPNAVMKKIITSTISLCLFALRNIEPGDEIRYDYGPGGNMPWRTQGHDTVHLFDNPIQSDSVIVSSEVGGEVSDQSTHPGNVVVSSEVTDQLIQSDIVVVSGEVSGEVIDQLIQPDSVVLNGEVSGEVSDQPTQPDSVFLNDEVSGEVTDQPTQPDSVVLNDEVSDEVTDQPTQPVLNDEVSGEVTDQPTQPDSVVLNDEVSDEVTDQPTQPGSVVLNDEVRGEVTDQSAHPGNVVVSGEAMFVDPTNVVVNREMIVKFEDFYCRYRPQLFKTNISINLNGNISCGIFSHVSEKQPREKNRHKLSRYGYCECCDVQYSNLNAHLQSYQHRMFVITKSNYEALDSFIENSHLSSSSFIKSLLNTDTESMLPLNENVISPDKSGSSDAIVDRKLVPYSDSCSCDNDVCFVYYLFRLL